MLTTANTVQDTDGINSSLVTGATAGAMAQPVMEQMKIPARIYLPMLNRLESMCYESAPFGGVKRIRGTVRTAMRLSLSRSKGQVILYLYDVDNKGNATFITHGFHTFWDAKALKVMDVKIPLVATAYDVPAGHHLALVIDTADIMYGRPDQLPFRVNFHHGPDGQSVLTVPFEE